ncbi:hypothetical protein H257_15710 [Aphanomyces astaci]|uniref:EGF-like domain-containing protein n=1 Tax=Aphanomyces astaci TaxID=112090 RepID=W4FNH6_APHAT|nr:hypothetical protein H257_15710 [Aphanomyces astaci]ETV68399.1 hypothetical protein H257_15710 [Aphanomyces astaci]RQM11072.1 hypothetical protein B5M09_008568 [Aphanomyces astaci]|eukprot:XP_009842194.1 hypothetical protein H257_15710 [Aphanomyces astaci]
MSERTPLFVVSEDNSNSRAKKAALFAIGIVGALGTVGYFHHAATNPIAPLSVVSFDVEEPEVPISSTTPGNCRRTSDCTKYGAEYSCVAVESSIAGLTLLSQCVRGAVCTGNVNGLCPSFNSWTTKFRQIQPVCAFAEVKNCDNALNADGTSVNEANANKTVTCFAATFSNKDGDEKEVNGIYKCVDAKLYAEKKLGFLDLTTPQLLSCAGNSSAFVSSTGIKRVAPLCNGRGTCAPTTQFNSTYACKCNGGYSADDNCYEPVGNVCDGFGQCGALGSCDPKNGACVCKVGAKGDQCSKCDVAAPAENVCSGQGVCGVDASCQCADGFEGLHCETRSKSNGTAIADSDDAPKVSSATSFSLSTLAAVALLATSFLL